MGNIIDPLFDTDEITIRFSSTMDYDYASNNTELYFSCLFVLFHPIYIELHCITCDRIISYQTSTIKIRIRIIVYYRLFIKRYLCIHVDYLVDVYWYKIKISAGVYIIGTPTVLVVKEIGKLH